MVFQLTYLQKFHYLLYLTMLNILIKSTLIINQINQMWIQFQVSIILSMNFLIIYYIIIINNQIMSVADISIFLIFIITLHFIKSRRPNFLFFAKGAILFLPPKPEEVSQLPKNKKKPNANQREVEIVEVQNQHIKQQPLSNQYDRITILTTAILSFLLFKILIKLVIPQDIYFLIFGNKTSFLFYVNALILFYAISVSLRVFWVSSYNIKYCIGISVGLNFLYYLLYIFFKHYGVYDDKIESQSLDNAKFLSKIFGIQILQKFEGSTTLIIVLVANTFITVGIIPTVLKFGNWYAKTLKQAYYENQQEIKEPKTSKAATNLKQRSKVIVKYLNIYLFVSLALIFLCHRFFHTFLAQNIIDILRSVIVALIIGINCYFLKDAIEFNASFAYQYITKFFQSSDQQQRLQLRKKIIPYIYFFWYHVFHYMTRIIILVLIWTMIIDFKYLSENTHITDFVQKNSKKTDQLVSLGLQCRIQSDPISMIENLSYCRQNQLIKIQKTESRQFSLNGLIQQYKQNDNIKNFQQKLSKMGLLYRPYVLQFLELLFWYSQTNLYLLTVLCILFLRKTYYDI